MSSKINNSLSTFLEQAMILEKNSLETISKVSDAVTSNETEINLELTDPTDASNNMTFKIPSFGYLKSEIERLNNTINTIANVNGNNGSSIRLSDGTYRRIIASSVPTEAPTITSVNNITTFNFKSNWFFEDMLNPSLYISWDMSNQISPDTERILIQRYILKCDTKFKKDSFDTELKGRNNVNYNEFLNFIINNKIRYNIDDEVKDLPPRSKRYYGNFSVIKITKENDVEGRNVNRYTLSSLEYTDTRSSVENTRILSVGDIVEVVRDDRGKITTRYEVTYANVSENKIGLKCIEGTDGIRVGSGVLRISSTQDNSVFAEIPVGFDEREVIFVKPIDPISNIPANEWSPGVAFYTNELTYVDSYGNTQTLQRFYQKNVVDFGQVLLSYSTDYYPSIREGLKPNPPILNYEGGAGDFKIVQINNQLREGADAETLRKLVSDKLTTQSEIDNLVKQIAAQKEAIQTTKFATTNDKLSANNTLSALVSNHATLVSNYNSIIGSIKAKYDVTEDASPKYRVRGFWDMPDSRISESSGEQKIIRFKIRYRYLSNSGNTNREEEFSYTSNGVKVLGRFSNWIEIETKQRERIKTPTGWEWEDIDTSDPEKVNINQLDIPIQKGEQVEIQVRSVSEAGWPSNPLESDWSDSIIVAFSDFSELEADDIEDIIEQNRIDASLANVSSLLSSSNEHMSSSFYTNDKYFAHTAESITSGFLSPEQTPVTLYDKLQDLQNQITKLMERIDETQGRINVSLVDDVNGKVYALENGSTIYINAGNYLSDISNLDVNEKNGAIITKIYYVEITSTLKSGLHLLSKLSGNRLSMCPNTINENEIKFATDDYDCNLYEYYDNIVNPSVTSSNYYKERGRYDLVPINLVDSEFIDFQIASPNMYQSAQCNGQFIYSRFRDIGDTFDMYANAFDDGGYGIFKGDARYSNSEECYDISEGMRIKYYNDNYKKVFEEYNNLTSSTIEINDDGDKNDSKDWYETEGLKQYINRIPKTWNKKPNSSKTLLNDKKILARIANINANDIEEKIKASSKLASRLRKLTNNNLTTNIINPKIQTAYGFSDLGLILGGFSKNTSEDDGSYLTTHKIGYEDKDKYSNGENTCNSYLFLSPINHSDIQVDGDTQESKKFVDSEKAIRVPIMYQYRMTDYDGNIFGNPDYDSTSEEVKKAKYANIIGLDIWTTNDWGKPSQFDIVVYSTYGNTTQVDISNTNNSTQLLLDEMKHISINASNLMKVSQTLTPNIV